MAGLPFLAGRVTSHTPKPFLDIGVAVTSQLSAGFSEVLPKHEYRKQDVLKSPTRLASMALGAHSRYVISPF